MNYHKIIEDLECESIPNTKALQKLRIGSIEQSRIHEEAIKEDYPKEYNAPRLTKISERDLKKVYSLAMPLSFPRGDPADFHPYETVKMKTHYSRWTDGDFKGVMHLTTEKGLNKLIQIFVKNKIPVVLEEASHELFDFRSHGSTPAISIPHSYQEPKNPSKGFYMHQFLVEEDKIEACPYYYVEKQIVSSSERGGYPPSWISIEDQREKSYNFYCRSTFYPVEEDGSIWRNFKPENYLPKLLKKYEENRKTQDYKNQILESLELELLKIGDPIEIYDPSWIKV